MVSGIYPHPKDPDEVSDHEWDFVDDLQEGETITTHTVTVSGVTLNSSAVDGTAVRAWLSGGTAGTDATIMFKITTSNTPSRTFERTATLRIRER